MSFSLLQSAADSFGIGPAALLTGQGVLTLGDVTFEGMELPEQLPQGGSQSLVVHKLAGGKRIVDAMGPDDEDVTWEGRLFGATAHLRSLRLDMMRRSGREVELAWGLRAYRVIVSSYIARVEDPFLVSYTISCTIVADLVAGDGAEESATLEQMIAADVAIAEAAARLAGMVMTAASVVHGITMAARPSRSRVADLPPEDMARARTAAAEGATGATAAAEQADAALATPGGIPALEPGMPPWDAAATLSAGADAADQAYHARMAAAAMTRVGMNLNEAVP